MFLLYPRYPSAAGDQESMGQLAGMSSPVLLQLTIPQGMAYLHSFTMDEGLCKSDKMSQGTLQA